MFQRCMLGKNRRDRVFKKKPRWSRHNSGSSNFWLLLQLLLFVSPPSCFCQTCCFLAPFIWPSHIPVGNPLLSYTGCVSWDTALPGDALPGATHGLAPDAGSGQTLLPQPETKSGQWQNRSGPDSVLLGAHSQLIKAN